MGRTGRWITRSTSVAAWAVVAGCQAGGGQPVPLVFSQTPPTVQAAYSQDHRDGVIQAIGRTSRDGDDYYTIAYTLPDGSKHDVVYNGAGNEIDKH